MKHISLTLGLSLLLSAMTLPTFSQVSNDNEDEVNKIDERFAKDFVPGQVLVKFKDESTIKVHSNGRGKFRTASISAVDLLLREYGVDEMEKLFPNEVAKPKSQLRRKKAPNGTIVQEKNLDKVFLLKTKVQSPDSTFQLIERLQGLKDVEYAEPNYRVYITADFPPSDLGANHYNARNIKLAPVQTETDATVICANPEKNPLYSQQYGITQQNIHTLWDKPIINKKRPVIAILDTGVDITHPDLKDNIWQNTQEVEGEAAYDDDGNGIVDDKYGWNFIDDYYETIDCNGHGTHVAGIAAAADNEIGIVGANPLALIMPVKVLADSGAGDIATVCRGLVYAADNGADIINMSFGHPENISQSEIYAIERAYQTALLVASAGNNGSDVYNFKYGPLWPAGYYLVFGVQASDSSGQLVYWSNFDPDGPIYSEDGLDGRNHEIMVPGDNIYSTYLNGNYKKLSGTSMASPLFAGAISALQMVKEYPSREALIGDVIHLNSDFYSIYNEDTPRTPFIDFGTILIDDSELGNNDKQIDAGETIALSVVLQNTWASCNDISLRLSVDPEYSDLVNIINPNVDFGGELSAYGRMTSVNPIIVSFAENIAHGVKIKFLLEAIVGKDSLIFSKNIYLTVYSVTKLGGLINKNTTLLPDKVYYIENDLLVSGCTLTIQPGARLEFADGKTLKIAEGAHINAHGLPGKMIVFTGSGVNGWNMEIPLLQATFWTNSKYSKWSYTKTSETPVAYTSTLYSSDKHYYSGGTCLTPDPSLYSKTKTDDYPYTVTKSKILLSSDTLSYCMFDNINKAQFYLEDCILINCPFKYGTFPGNRVNYINTEAYIREKIWEIYNSNIINIFCTHSTNTYNVGSYARYIRDNNYFNIVPLLPDTRAFYMLSSESNYSGSGDGKITPLYRPSYFGSSKEDIIQPKVYQFGNADGVYTLLDLSNMRKEPIHEAHGIVWKVVVNGFDAQDEFDKLAPLGIGRHKCEVYFNRPMNKNKVPLISFGVREPYTQHLVNEDGGWNQDGTIYTAYFTITGKTKSDGLNRIYVYGAEDNEYFEIPYEKNRFNVIVQAAGSLATGFMAEAGLGKVDLTWNNENNDFEDAMGFNVYRYTMVNDSTTSDTIRINQEIVDIETTEYTDYNVTPGTTYYYMYKVLSTDLQEYDVSNVVTATPLTSTLGDANGSGDVDVADVITTVNYAAGQQPKPFIFEAADMNTDSAIDILDVIGIIKKIMNPDAEATAMVEATATYTIENGTLYVESPVALAGVQVQLAIDNGTIRVADDLNGFEHLSAWLSDNDYLFMAYNMNGKTLTPGKHALLHIGNGKISDIRLSDANGRNIVAVGDEATRVNRMASDVMTVKGIYDLQGRKLTGDSSKEVQLPKGVYIVNGKKVVR